MFIKQISVFLENTKGTLYELTKLLGNAKIDLLALSIADTENFGIVRCIVRDAEIDPALEKLRGAGYTAKVNDVICAGVPHRPSGLSDILKILEDEGVAIEYLYSFMFGSGDEAYITLRPSDKEKGLAVLEKNGIKLIDQKTVDAIK